MFFARRLFTSVVFWSLSSLYHARLSISDVKISSRVQLERSSGQFGIKYSYRPDLEFSLGGGMRGLGYPPMYGRGPNNLQCVTHYISRLSPRNHYYDRNVDTNVDAARLEACRHKGMLTS